MYNPKHFTQTDRSIIVEAMRTLGAAELITFGSSGIEASIAPLLINDGATVLRGHLARANNQWKHADPSVPVLVTWRGPDAYISPSFYPSKAENGKVVPTWNYTTVQARGMLTVHDDIEWVEDIVRSLTMNHEARFAHPWSVDDAPREYINSMLQAIIGIEIQITSIDAKWKLSQNRSADDIEGVIVGLQTQTAKTSREVAVAVRLAGSSRQRS